MDGLIVIAIFLFILLMLSLKIVYAYERGVLFTLGRFSGIINPGLRVVIPILQRWVRVDTRVRAVDVPEQDAITKDNVSVSVNAVLYFRVLDTEKAIIKVENFNYAISQLAQTTMRDTVGEVSLDELLTNRDDISKRIEKVVDKSSDKWGIKVLSVDLKHIELPKNLKRTMAKEAEAERERRAVIIKARGEVIASNDVSRAARILGTAPGALHLRTLQTLNDVSSDSTNKIHFYIPVDVIGAIESIKR